MPDAGADPDFPQTVNGRYRIEGPPIGQGGMGIVYRAYDTTTKRHVALKTTWSHVDPAALELFEREWTVLARLSHPNIVDILDTGELRQGSEVKPYFVMPLLPGRTLDRLIRSPGEPFAVERTVDIVTQVCRGLQAAHLHGLVHRDLKPSNIFVLDDDTVKIIDFGVVHLADTRSIAGLKGTLQYMAPEQIELQPVTPSSDIFSLGVVCYEALTSRKPFARATDVDTAEAIRGHMPPPVCDINAAVSRALSRTVHKALAKQPWHRFPNAREFGETLQKALRNEPIERFDRRTIQPRIERIKKAYNDGDLQFATEILSELESEGHMETEMPALRRQIEQALRERNVRELLNGAHTRLEDQEYSLALQKLQDALRIDPQNEEALGLKREIERRQAAETAASRQQHSSEDAKRLWVEEVDRHFTAGDYDRAREAIAAALRKFPDDQELHRLESLAANALRRMAEIRRLLEQGTSALASGNCDAAVESFRSANRLDDHNPEVRSALLRALVEKARLLVGKDWRAAESIVKEAIWLDDRNPLARALLSLIEHYRHDDSRRHEPGPAAAGPVEHTRLGPAEGAPLVANAAGTSRSEDRAAAGGAASSGTNPAGTGQSSQNGIDLRRSRHGGNEDEAESRKLPIGRFLLIGAICVIIAGIATFTLRWYPALQPAGVAKTNKHSPVQAAAPPPPAAHPAVQHSGSITRSMAARGAEAQSKQPDAPTATAPAMNSGVGRPAHASAERLRAAPGPVTDGKRPPDGIADVDLLSDPPGATMAVDDNSQTTCDSPCTLSLPNGVHTLTVEMEGYKTASRTFNTPDESSLYVPLTRNTGVLIIASSPTQSSIIIDGKDYGRTPARIDIQPGQHRVELIAGGNHQQRIINVQSGALIPINIRWQITGPASTAR